MMTSPIQKAEKLPATKPDRMFSEAPPCLEQLVDFLDVPRVGADEDLGELRNQRARPPCRN